MTRLALRAGARAMKQALRPPPKARKTTALKSTSGKPALAKRTHAKRTLTKRALTSGSPSASACASAGQWSTGVALSAGGARRYRLYKPPGVRRTERLPLVVMLHGCAQDAQALAASTKMNRIAQRERFLVLYPEQDRLANLQGCWNWYDTRSGRAQREAASIDAAINQVCLKQPVDPNCIALAGLSAGASLAALLAVRRPARFRAIVMHSGIAPGVATSSATALGAMRGRRVAAPLAALAAGTHLPALLVIQGSADPLVAPGNGPRAVRLWADREAATPGPARTVQRGTRYPATITDYRKGGRLVATLCDIKGLGHAWSGGAAGCAYSDPKGPDASRMSWAFIRRQFAAAPAGTRKSPLAD